MCKECGAQIENRRCSCGTNCGVLIPYNLDGSQHSCIRYLAEKVAKLELKLRERA